MRGSTSLRDCVTRTGTADPPPRLTPGAGTPGAPPNTPVEEPLDRDPTRADGTPVPTPKLRTPARRTVERWVPYDYGAERKRTRDPDSREPNGKSDGDETGPEADSDLRGSSAGEVCAVFEVCSHSFSSPPLLSVPPYSLVCGSSSIRLDSSVRWSAGP